MFTNHNKNSEISRQKIISRYVSGKVLDLGIAQNPNKFLKSSGQEVYGLDINMPSINILPYYDHIIIHDINKKFPFKNNTFDSVVAGEVLEHLKNPLNLISESKRVLKKNGVLIITTPSPLYYLEILARILNIELIREHISLCDRMSLRKLLEINGFKVKKIEGINFWIPLLKIGIISEYLPEYLSWHQLYISIKTGGSSDEAK